MVLFLLLISIFPALGSFIAPNETNPQNQIRFLNLAPRGALVSVGSERGFISAGLSQNFSDLILLDYDPEIIRFNDLNIRLLKASKNRKDYLKLRFANTSTIWSGVMDWTEEDFLWWRKILKVDDFKTFHLNPDRNLKGEFLNANYLYYDTQYQRLKRLANADKIKTFQADFRDSLKIQEIMKSNELKVSVLDLSNVWQSAYIGSLATEKLIHQLELYLSKNAIIMITEQASTVSGMSWRYIDLTQEVLKASGGFMKWSLYSKNSCGTLL